MAKIKIPSFDSYDSMYEWLLNNNSKAQTIHDVKDLFYQPNRSSRCKPTSNNLSYFQRHYEWLSAICYKSEVKPSIDRLLAKKVDNSYISPYFMLYDSRHFFFIFFEQELLDMKNIIPNGLHFIKTIMENS